MADLAIPREEKVISAQGGSTIVLDGVEHVNFACLDFLSFLGEGRVHDACEATIRKYGVGSCGPRCANPLPKRPVCILCVDTHTLLRTLPLVSPFTCTALFSTTSAQERGRSR